MPSDPHAFCLPESASAELVLQFLPLLQVALFALREPGNATVQAQAKQELGAAIDTVRQHLKLVQPLPQSDA